MKITPLKLLIVTGLSFYPVDFVRIVSSATYPVKSCGNVCIKITFLKYLWENFTPGPVRFLVHIASPVGKWLIQSVVRQTGQFINRRYQNICFLDGLTLQGKSFYYLDLNVTTTL